MREIEDLAAAVVAVVALMIGCAATGCGDWLVKLLIVVLIVGS